ncbi:MAG: hypothetical protein QW041_00275 [Candidatus Pacearchaeota archaeon]
MNYTLKSGFYKGKNIAQIALTSYSGYEHLKKILEHWQGSNHQLAKDISYVINQLNHFVPIVNCKYCNNPAEKIHTPYKWETNPYSGKKYRDFQLNASEYYCSKHSKNYYKNNIHITNIKFDSIIYYNNKKEALNYFLYNLMGFKGKKTAKNCKIFIRNLKQKHLAAPDSIKSVQLDLF